MNEPLCVAPFIGFYYKGSTKQIKACCESKEWGDNQEFNSAYKFKGKGSWEEIWTNEKLKKMRKELMEGKYPETCWKCISLAGLAHDQKRSRTPVIKLIDFNLLSQ